MIRRFFEEMISHRHLVGVLLLRHLRILYRGTFLGFLWTFLNPMLHVATYSVIYYLLIRPGMPNYPVFLLCGILPWVCFSTSLTASSTVIADNAWLIKNVRLPSQVLPIVAVLLNFVHFALSLPCLFIMMMLVRIPVGWSWLYLLPIIVLQFLLTEGLVLILSVVNFRFRDMRYMIPNLVSIWFILTPIIYPISQAPEPIRPTFRLNPMSPIAVAFQNVLFYGQPPPWTDLACTLTTTLAVLAVGICLFEHFKWSFAEGV